MAIKILRKGATVPVPEHAKYCPACGKGPVIGSLEDTHLPNIMSGGVRARGAWHNGVSLPALDPDAPLPALVPMFTCPACGCIWQVANDEA